MGRGGGDASTEPTNGGALLAPAAAARPEPSNATDGIRDAPGKADRASGTDAP